MRYLYALVLIIFSFASYAEDIESPALLATLDHYWQSLHSGSCQFRQWDRYGQFQRGQLWFVRPDYLRLDYEDPTPLSLYISKQEVVIYDAALDYASYHSIVAEQVPLLLSAEESLSAQLHHHIVTINDDLITLSGHMQTGAATTEITLAFTAEPLALIQLAMKPEQGEPLWFEFESCEWNAVIDPLLFTYRPAAKEGWLEKAG